MKKSFVIIIIIMVFLAVIAVIYQESYEVKQRNDVITLVDQAVVKIQENGEAAFPEFYTPKWFQGDKYVFVWRTDGIRVVYPPDPKAVDINMTNLKDATGKPIGKQFIETAEKGGGWVSYLWPKPNSTIPIEKMTYIQDVKVGNKSYLVGSGFYI